MRPVGPKVCECVRDHNPEPKELHAHHIIPLYLNGPDEVTNLVWLCPTTHSNVHMLIRRWVSNGHEPAWWTLRLFSPYVRELARIGYLGSLDAA